MSMIKVASIFALALAFGAVGNVNAADLLVTTGSAKASGVVSLDIVSDGDVSGFNFSISTGKAKFSEANLSKCVADLPAGFDGACRLTNGTIYVFAMAKGLATLPKGTVSVGTIMLPSRELQKAGATAADLKVDLVEFVDVNGRSLATTKFVNGQQK